MGEMQEEEPGQCLATVVLEPDAADSLGDALYELQEAARLFREGLCPEAAARLAKAEELIDSSPSSKSRAQLRRASCSDPELKDLKQLTKSLSLGGDKLLAGLDADKCGLRQTGGSHVERDFGFQEVSAPDVNQDADGTVDATKSQRWSQMRHEKLEELEAELSRVRVLCRQAQIFEAHAALIKLQASLAESCKAAVDEGDYKLEAVLRPLEARLQADPVLVKLSVIHARMESALSMLRTPNTKSKSEVSLEATDPKLGEHFRLNLSLRFAQGAERQTDGPTTQVIVRGDMRNLPTSLVRAIVENTEVDLFQKEWMKDCKAVAGKAGRAPRLYCAMVHYNLSPPLLPLKLDDVVLREFAVCKDGDQFPDRGPGVIVIEHRAPDGETEFEGMEIPPKRKGVVRVKGGMTAYYKTQSQLPGFANIVAVSTMGLPVPQYLLPLSLLKKVAADLILGSTRLMAGGLYGKWEETQYSKRYDSGEINADFFKLVSELPADKLGGR